MITIEGFGAYIGLAQKTNNGDSYIPVSTKMYRPQHGDRCEFDRMEIALVMPDGAAWTFYLVHYHDANDLPPIPIAGPASFSYERGNHSDLHQHLEQRDFCELGLWDGNFSTDYNAVHTYAGDGDYTVTLTVSDDNFATDEATATISISSAVFTAADLSSAEGKVWRLTVKAPTS